MYQVLDCNKPADYHHHKVEKSWDRSEYETFEEALEYAKKWFYPFFPLNPKDAMPNVKYSYGGYKECTMEIREK